MTFPVVYSFTGKRLRIRQNNDIKITSEMALVYAGLTNGASPTNWVNPKNLANFWANFSSFCGIGLVCGTHVLVSQTRPVPQTGLIPQVGPKFIEIPQITVGFVKMQLEKEETGSLWVTSSNDVNIMYMP